MATSTLDIIKQAFSKIGVIGSGETPSADDANSARKLLNQMLDLWTLNGLMCYCNKNDTLTLTSGTSSYTIGSGGNINTHRPNRIDCVTVNDGTNDYAVEIVTNEEYRKIYDKTTTGTPSKIMYNPEYPLGKIYLWPIPDAADVLTVSHRLQLSQMSSLVEDFSLPEGYELCITYNLALLLADEYKATISPNIYKIAIDSKAAIKRANSVPSVLTQELAEASGIFDINSGAYL
jgi:hypothetical protein